MWKYFLLKCFLYCFPGFTFYILHWWLAPSRNSQQSTKALGWPSHILHFEKKKKSWVNEQRWWLLISKNLWKRSLEINNKRGFPLHWLRNTYYDVHCENMKRSLPMNTEKYNWKWQFISIHHHRFVQIVLILVCFLFFHLQSPKNSDMTWGSHYCRENSNQPWLHGRHKFHTDAPSFKVSMNGRI